MKTKPKASQRPIISSGSDSNRSYIVKNLKILSQGNNFHSLTIRQSEEYLIYVGNNSNVYFVSK